MLIALNKEIVRSLKKFREQTFKLGNNIENCIPYHTAILEAFGRKDVELAQKRLMEHLERVEIDLESSKNFTEN